MNPADILDRLDRLADEGGFADPESLREFRGQANLLRDLMPGSDEKVASAIGWAEILFSDRKHQKWATDSTEGAVRVRSFIRGDLMSLRLRLPAT